MNIERNEIFIPLKGPGFTFLPDKREIFSLPALNYYKKGIEVCHRILK